MNMPLKSAYFAVYFIQNNYSHVDGSYVGATAIPQLDGMTFGTVEGAYAASCILARRYAGQFDEDEGRYVSAPVNEPFTEVIPNCIKAKWAAI